MGITEPIGKERASGDTATSQLYQARFRAEEQARKDELWKVVCAGFFQRFVGPDDVVVDLGAGFCEFINHI